MHHKMGRVNGQVVCSCISCNTGPYIQPLLPQIVTIMELWPEEAHSLQLLFGISFLLWEPLEIQLAGRQLICVMHTGSGCRRKLRH